MRLKHIEQLGHAIGVVKSIDELSVVLTEARQILGFRHFALSLSTGQSKDSMRGLLVHDYPAGWADLYLSLDLGRHDPVRRAVLRRISAFRWSDLFRKEPPARSERAIMEQSSRYGIADGLTVPRHLPGRLSGSCSFVVGSETALHAATAAAAEYLGGRAIDAGRRLLEASLPTGGTLLTPRQCECILWAARGKTDWEIAVILGISKQTVIQHLKDARRRYGVQRRSSLVMHALFDGAIDYADVVAWYRPRV
ncbi:helix-turn-helix transcriptional regulator [Sphingomonas sp. FW199]|uniref:helix-turn-helix transcriptional regulator n=1 Tax=Sphingomonas sp. FW199 TaxID=3400217 RepID=UPI003CEC1DB0